MGSVNCTWAIVLGYASVVCFEACALPTIITYIFPDFLQGYLYTVAGFKIYASWLAVAVGMSLLMTWINIRGVKAAAKLQTILTVIIGAAGILLIVASTITGSVSTLAPQAFVGEDTGTTIKAVLAVAVMTPFYFIGFDVIPQAAEEIKVPLKKIGSILILSVVCAVLFYALVIVAVGLVLTGPEILASENGTGLVTADAMAKAMNSATMAKVIIIGGMCGSITDYEGGGKVPGDIIPLIAIPTTAGTGSEVTAFSVITDHARNYKLTVFSYKLIPKYAILDADFLTTAPARVAAACGIDAMVHAIEAYISRAASPFSDAMAEKALELIGGNIAVNPRASTKADVLALYQKAL